MNNYEKIANNIISQLDNNIIPWHRPWRGEGGCISSESLRPYSFLNHLLLGFNEGQYFTFNQVKNRGGSIRKGAHASPIFFYTRVPMKKQKNDNGEEEFVTPRPVLKQYLVFHQDDVLGVELKHPPINEIIAEPEQVANDYVNRSKVALSLGGNKAYYSPSTDSVRVPKIGQFDSSNYYYATLFHELAHSTMRADRCDRPQSIEFGDEVYSREELVAELASAILCNRCGIELDKVVKNQTAYIRSWRDCIKKDPGAIVWASSRAVKAARYILGEADDEAEAEAS